MVTNNSLNNSSSPFDVDNIHLETNSISTTDTNGNLILAPDGTGDVNVSTGDVNILGGAVSIDPGAATDSYIQFDESTTGKWRIGNDATDDSYRISQGSALGTNDTFIMTSGGTRTLPLQPAFLVTNSGTLSNVTGDDTNYTIVWDTEVYDVGGNFASNTFTAPVAGLYHLYLTVRISGFTGSMNSGYIFITASTAGTWRFSQFSPAAATGGNIAYSGSVVLQLAASETVNAHLLCGNDTKTVSILASQTSYFGGYLLG